MQLLFVAHCPSENTRALRDSALEGIASLHLEQLEVVAKSPLDAVAADVLASSGVIIGTTENFGAMAGLVKDFFERIYYPCLDATQGLPAVYYVRAGEDGTGTKAGINKIMTGLRWKQVAEPRILRGPYDEDFCQQTAELAMTIAAGIESGIF